MSELITDPVEAAEWLFTHHNLDVEDFIKSELGDVTIGEVVFHFRVGLHMGKPAQVIICKGSFIRICYIDEKWHNAQYGLKVLDPKKPNAALYNKCWNPNGFSSDKWRPVEPDPELAQGHLIGHHKVPVFPTPPRKRP